MKITIDETRRTAALNSGTVSYVLEAVDGKYLVHRYFGRALRDYRGCGTPAYYKRAYSTTHDCSVPNASFDDFPFEYPVRGRGDFRIPALTVEQANGVQVVEPLFRGWRVIEGKPGIPGLPSTFTGDTPAQTLEVVCEDEQAGLRVLLYYSVFEGIGIIARHQRFENIGKQTLVLHNTQSASLELPARPYEFLSLYGTHAKEANRSRFPLHHGIQRVESVRGSSTRSTSRFLPCCPLARRKHPAKCTPCTWFTAGTFWHRPRWIRSGMCGRRSAFTRKDSAGNWSRGGSFATPEAILNYSAAGLNGMSQTFHRLYREHLMPRRFAETERPILLNSWESMYYDVSMEKIEAQAELAKQSGLELFVLDDGWFRADNSSNTSMGDWQCNEAKLPGGIRRASETVHAKGLKFGLWFEPEAVCKNSTLYRMYPDWILHIPGYAPVEGRHEHLLDLTRQEVRDYLAGMLEAYLQGGKVDYIKWDMNRPLTDVCSSALGREHKGETAHRYVLGLYEILERIAADYPSVLIEGCSSGGARFDPGMLYYVAQNWASDNTDAYDRMTIQDGFSLLYPPVAIGAHVSITPNHQTGRTTPLDTRYQAARLFNLGYELDLAKCSEAEREVIARQVSEHKRERAWMQEAIFSRHEVPSGNYQMWSLTRPDRSECQCLIFQKFYDPLCCHGNFRLLGLDPEADYRETGSGQVFGGDELMQIGLTVPLVKEDFHAFPFHFLRIEDGEAELQSES